MINTGEFKDLIKEVVQEEIGDRTRYKIGEIASVGDKVTVKFSGEQEPSLKEYTYLKSYYPIVGDRVLLARDKGTYVVLGKLFGSIAGYIIESGSNNNGHYVKFSDGTMICHLSNISVENIETVTSVVQGLTIYRSGGAFVWTFPVIFKIPPSVTMSTHLEKESGVVFCFTFRNYGVYGDHVNLQIVAFEDFKRGTHCNYIAIGRWK